MATNTREKLLDVAQELIQKRGVNGMSFQDLSDQVGIRKASVHHHFSSKAEMVHALLDRYQEQFQASVDRILTSRSNGKNQLKRYCQLFVDTLASGSKDCYCLFGMLMAEIMSLDGQEQTQVCRFIKSNLEYLENILAKGAEDGSLQKQANNRQAAFLLLSAMEGGLLIARCNEGPKQLNDLVTYLITSHST